MIKPEENSESEKVVSAIQHNTQWTGRTTRELRDKVEHAAIQIEALAKEISEASRTSSNDLFNLTDAINSYSASSDKLSKKMLLLTVVLALATVASAIASCALIFKH